ncbi:MAG: excinuclease ABC subunit UvrA, partial [Deltaproteobacteria bacterium]|nr:excinuclease ABC subunit UvrA [Deltaproteobacteria bacterium]
MPDRPETENIVVVGAAEHNLQNVSLTLPRDTLTVFTGVSGSGKSSLAFDTIFKEGQRRFLESLSPYARQFLGQMEKPRVEHVEGLSPTISIDQKTVNRNPRSTVGTVTELYDLYRLLFARFGKPHCPGCGKAISSQTPQQIADHLFARLVREEDDPAPPAVCLVLAPMVRQRKGEYRKEMADWVAQGWLRARINGRLTRLDEDSQPVSLARYEKQTIELVVDRLTLTLKNRSRLTEAVEKAVELSGGLVGISVENGPLSLSTDPDSENPAPGNRVRPDREKEEPPPATDYLFSSKMACPACQIPIPEMEPRLFSFNAPQGACPDCQGLGHVHRFSEALLTDPAKPIRKGAFVCVSAKGTLPFTTIRQDDLAAVALALNVNPAVSWGRLSALARKMLLHGTENATPPGVNHVFRHPRELVTIAQRDKQWPGLIPILEFITRFVGGALDRYREVSDCPGCRGRRLNPVALAVTFHHKNVEQLAAIPIEESLAFFEGLKLTATEAAVGKDIFREIRGRLAFLNRVGVGYLSISRSSVSLSGGEAQRIRLASQLGSGLQGVLYVLDEPSIGLHQTDNRKLIQTLQDLRDKGNTVFVMEHDQETIASADWVVDMGPGAGVNGGRLLAMGTPDQVAGSPQSVTGGYLSGREEIPLPVHRRKVQKDWAISIHKANKRNLKNLNVSVPLGVFVAVTGVSGSGKSTLVHEILKRAVTDHLSGVGARGDYEKVTGLDHVDKVIEIDQAPIGRTPRSNPATYTKAFDAIRQLFAEVPESRIRGYQPGRFSFNVKGGRCETCQGAGVRTIEMQFLANVEIPCEDCRGRRFHDETLQIHYKGKTIYDVLEMTVAEGAAFFTNVPIVHRILDTLEQVGLGYIRLGQAATTLSGGEAQRVKLASELKKRATGRTLYLLDEPTTGLHFADIKVLLAALQELVNQGNTVLVIEHNLDVIKVADHVLDLGPGGGAKGGKVVAQGTPAEVAANPESATGRVLAELLTPGLAGRKGGTPPGDGAQAGFAAGLPQGTAPARGGKRDISIRGAEKNNLKSVDVVLPRNQLTVITGPSGSGKTSLAFDTLFAEGQARYVESLSTYARRFLGRLDKPRVDSIDGLAPAIAIDQKNSSRSPRSTVATAT